MSGQIIDASLIPAAPRQHYTEAEKAAISAGQSAEEIWPEQPGKAAQKDTDARWMMKFTRAKPKPDGTVPAVDLAIATFGYKEPLRDRPSAWVDPDLDGDRCRAARWGTADRVDRQDQYGDRGLGGHGVSVEEE